MDKEIKTKKLEDIYKEVATCTKCPLYKHANCGVPGEGSSTAQVMFIGEAPGANEDKLGKPFVGRAGALLDKGLSAIKLERKDVYIANIIKHRPPGNRDPKPQEIEACRTYLDRQINIIQPNLIVTLGRFSMEHFVLGNKISAIRGKLVKRNNLNIYPMFHPAAALRQKNFMKSFVADFMNIPNVLNELENLSKSTKNSIKPKQALYKY